MGGGGEPFYENGEGLKPAHTDGGKMGKKRKEEFTWGRKKELLARVKGGWVGFVVWGGCWFWVVGVGGEGGVWGGFLVVSCVGGGGGKIRALPWKRHTTKKRRTAGERQVRTGESFGGARGQSFYKKTFPVFGR